MIATSSAAVSTGSNEPRVRQVLEHARRRSSARPRRPGRRATIACEHLRLLDHLRDLARAQQRHRRHDDPAREQDPEPGGDRLRGVRRVQQHARPRLDLQRAGDRLGALAQLVVAPARPRSPCPRAPAARPPRSPAPGPSSSSRSGHCRGVGQPVARERVHQSRPGLDDLLRQQRRVREHHLVAAGHLDEPAQPEPRREPRVPAPLRRAAARCPRCS